jgi:hypothetical protein
MHGLMSQSHSRILNVYKAPYKVTTVDGAGNYSRKGIISESVEDLVRRKYVVEKRPNPKLRKKLKALKAAGK